MSLKLPPLFTSEPVEPKRDEALRALDRAVARLGPAERLLPRPPRLGAQVRYRLFEIEMGGQDEDPGSGRCGAGLEAAAERPVSARQMRIAVLAGAVGVLPARGWPVEGRKARRRDRAGGQAPARRLTRR